MTGSAAVLSTHQFADENGDPLIGGKLYTYLAGTTTLTTTWTDHTLSTANTNPIILDSAGRCQIYFDDSIQYKLVLYTADDTLQWSADYQQSAAGALSGLSLVTSTQLATTIQTQSVSAFTTFGSAPTYSLTPTPAITSLVANQRFRVKAHASTSSGASTLAVSGLAAKSIKQYDSTGTKVDAIIAANQLFDTEYDGTDWVVLDSLPPTVPDSSIQVSVRQTVLTCPVDSSGLPTPGGSTGATSITTTAISSTAPFVVTAANGSSILGDVNAVGQSTANLTWTGLSSNGTMYLYVDIAAGALTTGVTSLAPVYQEGGAYSVSNGQFTFNISAMVGKVGNGSIATQTNRVFVGEVTVAGGVVTAIYWYAIRGRYIGINVNWPTTSTAISVNHNIGTVPYINQAEAVCVGAELGYSVGDVIMPSTSPSSWVQNLNTWRSSMSSGFTTSNSASLEILNKSNGVPSSANISNWKYRIIANRGW